jgi:DNA-directed RNA polymerase II subunit RPB2
LVQPGAPVKQNDILAAKSIPVRSQEDPNARRDTSTTTPLKLEGVVTRVMVASNDDGTRHSKIEIAKVCIPQRGDKFSSRHAQKGTVGLMLPQYDMPFDTSGASPDIILNPHAIPSRMTIGQLVEMLIGAIASRTGMAVDGTAFSESYRVALDAVLVDDTSRLQAVPDHDSASKIQIIGNVLHRMGLQRSGYSRMCNGHTGEMMKTPMFVGPCFYQRLLHRSAEKLHARTRGPVQVVTQQPVGGRSRLGGHRFGEMERDCAVSHGATAVLRERLFLSSDATIYYACALCGLGAIGNEQKQIFYCKRCQDNQNVHRVHLPYGFKLLTQELMATGVVPRFHFVEP